MSATLDQIYSYDLAIETAWKDALQSLFDADNFVEADGSIVQVGVHIEQSDESKVTPFVDVQLRDVQAYDRQHIGTDGVRYYSSWTGHLVSRVTTLRGSNSALQAKIIGLIRAHAANFEQVFSPLVLPFHQMLQMKDYGLLRGLIISQVLDYSEVTHQLIFDVRDDAWPV
jgi:hypothetical protein